MNDKRMPFDANSLEEVLQYWKTRARQISYAGFEWTGEITEQSFGYSTSFIHHDPKTQEDKKYISGFVLLNKRSQGLFLPWLKSQKDPIVTTHSCNLEPYFKKVGFTNYLIPSIPEVWPEYQMIQNFYKDKQANRSQLFLMNHIDEGLLVLQKIGASVEAQKAFCLHPIFQNDPDLKDNYSAIKLEDYQKVDPRALVLTMEYRSIANEYLSKRTIWNINEIRLSPLKEVSDMLIADKIQNYKDFLLYHKDTHHKSDDLDQYFKNWLKKLNCEEHLEWLMNKPFETYGTPAKSKPKLK